MQTDKHTIIRPKSPKSSWTRLSNPPQWVTLGYDGMTFFHAETGILVISAVERAELDKGEEDIGATYHLSISKNGGRCTSQEAKWVLRQFDMEDGEEDNHVPNGKVRNFWRPVADNYSGYQCPCKKREPAMIEDKGDYVWRGITK